MNIIHDIENQKLFYERNRDICLKYTKNIISVFENDIWIPEWEKTHYRITSLKNPIENRDSKYNQAAKKLVVALQKYIHNYDIISLLNNAYYYNEEKFVLLYDYYVKLGFIQIIDDSWLLEIKNNFYIKWSCNLETIDFYLQYLEL